MGRSDSLRKRIQQHGRPKSGTNTAAFALRKALRRFAKCDPRFEQAFNDAKSDIRKMRVSVVEVECPIEQAILEIYVHMKLGTEYNGFENH